MSQSLSEIDTSHRDIPSNYILCKLSPTEFCCFKESTIWSFKIQNMTLKQLYQLDMDDILDDEIYFIGSVETTNILAISTAT